MSKDRTITGFGPSHVWIESTGTGDWIPFGPFVGTQLSGQPLWSTAGSSNGQNIKIQASLHSGATGDIVDLFSFDSTDADTQINATSTKRFGAIRIRSTEMSTGGVTHNIALVVVV